MLCANLSIENSRDWVMFCRRFDVVCEMVGMKSVAVSVSVDAGGTKEWRVCSAESCVGSEERRSLEILGEGGGSERFSADGGGWRRESQVSRSERSL